MFKQKNKSGKLKKKKGRERNDSLLLGLQSLFSELVCLCKLEKMLGMQVHEPNTDFLHHRTPNHHQICPI